MRNLIRALHILATGVLLGGYIFLQSTTALEPWLLASVITGLLLLAIDLHASMAVLLEVRGLLLLIKLALLLLLPIFEQLSIPLLIIVLFIGAIGSHMTKRYRHKVLLFANFITPDERGG